MVASIFKKTMSALFGLMLISVLNAEIITATYDDEEQVLIKPEDIPVTIPEIAVPTVDVPVVVVPKTDAVSLQTKALTSYPFSLYSEPISVKIDDYPNAVIDSATGSIIIANIQDDDLYITSIIPASTEGTDISEVKVKVANISHIRVGNIITKLISDNGVMKLVDTVTGNIVIPNVSIESINEHIIRIASVDQPDVQIADVSAIEIETINVAVPNVYDPNVAVVALQELMNELRSKVHDKRSIDYDKTIRVGNEAIKKWMTIYSAYSSNDGYAMDYIPPHKGLRMITEARAPKTKEERAIQLDNLDWYRSKWYNACLLAIYMDEDLDDLINLANTIKEKGYDLYITYSGVETLESTVFKDPDVIKKYLSALAPMSRGFIIGWRKTSVHLFIQDYQFSRYLVECVRNANPKIEVFGEAYYGQTADTDNRTDRLTYNLPKNSTGCILVGVGYRQVNANGVLSGLFGALQQNQKFPVVLGDRAYYKTTNPNGRSFEENFAIKLEIEKKFLRSGAYGVITMHGDGYSEETDCLTSPRN